MTSSSSCDPAPLIVGVVFISRLFLRHTAASRVRRESVMTTNTPAMLAPTARAKGLSLFP